MKKKNLKKQIVKLSKEELGKVNGGKADKLDTAKIEVGVVIKF